MPRNNSPVKVHSYKRSGTHLLMASIYQNFKLPDVSINIRVSQARRFVLDGVNFETGKMVTMPWRGLFGGHGAYRPGAPQNKLIYIVRHPIPVLMSLWRIEDAGARRFEVYFGERKLDEWRQHVMSYVNAKCHWVRYEDLVGDNYDKTLEQIENWFGLVRKEPTFSRVKEHLGWYASTVPVHSKQPTEEIIDRFVKFFPNGVLGYDMTRPGEYDVK